MTPLRRRMIQDMQLRNFAPRTIIVYVNCVVRFARHFGKSPELLGPEDVRTYLLDMIEHRRQSWAYYNLNLQALRFLYNVTLGRPDIIRHLPFAKRPRTLPTVLSPEEALRFLDAALPGRDRTLLDTAYSCGLRLKELLGLQE